MHIKMYEICFRQWKESQDALDLFAATQKLLPKPHISKSKQYLVAKTDK